MSARRTHRLRIEALENRVTPSLTPVGNEFRVNIPTNGMERFSNIAADAAGNFVVAFLGFDHSVFPTSYGITAQRYRPDGTLIGSPIPVSGEAPLTDLIAVATDPTGGFVVVWTKYPAGIEGPLDPAVFGILGRSYDASGQPKGPVFAINQTDHPTITQPDVAFYPNGDFIVAWTTGTSTVKQILTRRFANDGSPLTGEVSVVSSLIETSEMPHLAMAPNGSYVLAWQTRAVNPSPPPGSIRYAWYGANDQPLTPTIVVGIDPSAFYDVVIGPNNTTAFAWQDSGTTGQLGFQLFGPTGVPLGSRVMLGYGWAPSLAISPNGDFELTWSNKQAYSLTFGLNSAITSPPMQVNTDSAFYNQTGAVVTSYNGFPRAWPAVAFNSAGDAMFTWSAYGEDGYSWGVYARNYFGSTTQPAAPPTLNGGTASRSSVKDVGLDFTRQVTLPANPTAAFQLTNTLGTVIPVSVDTAASSHFKLTFPTFPAGLPDGRYTLRMLAAQVHDAAGRMLDGNGDGTPGDDLVVQFHKLTGDFNGDGAVDQADLSSFRNSFGSTNLNYDLDGDGAVDMDDMIRFRNAFGSRL